jgi:hypothetical protein
MSQASSLGALLTFSLACVIAAGIALAQSSTARRRARDAQDAIDGSAALRDGGCVVVGHAAIEGETPLSVTLVEEGHEIRLKGSVRHEWHELRREVHAEPFEVVTSKGERVRIEPTDRVAFVDVLLVGQRTGKFRERIAELEDGEEISVTGTLRSQGDEGVGAYRAGPKRWVMKPPPDGVMIVSTQPLATRHAFWATFFRRASYVPVALLVVTNVLAFVPFWNYLRRGEPAGGIVTDVYPVTTRERHGLHTSYYANVEHGATSEHVVTSEAFERLHVGNRVALITVGTNDDAPFLGSEPGFDPWLCAAPIAIAIIAGLWLWRRAWMAKLWWEQKRVITRGTGPL